MVKWLIKLTEEEQEEQEKQKKKARYEMTFEERLIASSPLGTKIVTRL